MSYLFDGVDDVITATLDAGVADSDWTACAWVKSVNHGEGNAGVIFLLSDSGATRQRFRLQATDEFQGWQEQAGANASIATSTGDANPHALWKCLIAVYTHSTRTIDLFHGSESVAMAEVSGYFVDQTGTAGGTASAGTTLTIGNNTAGSATFNGRIARCAFYSRALDSTEREAFRQGTIPADDMVFFFPLDATYGTNDASGLDQHGTATGASYSSDDPSLGYTWGSSSTAASLPRGFPRGLMRGLRH